MAETSQKKITLSNFFEQIVEIDKISQQALKKSNESVSISEKTRLDLEKLIATLKISFGDNLQNVQAQSSSNQVTNIVNRNNNQQINNLFKQNIDQSSQISSLVREDAVEDRELRDSFLELQSSFRDLSSAVGILRGDLASLSNAFLQMQQGRSAMLKQQGRSISKEEDTLQKEQILGSQQKQQRQQVQDQKRTQEQKESKIMSALKGLLGGGLLAGLGGAFGGNPGGSPGNIPPIGDLSGDQQESENKMYDKLSKTYGKNVALGMLSNAMRESGYRTNAPEGGYFGMFQWDKNREANLREYAKSKGKSPYDRDIQVEFALMESQQSGTLERMKAAKSPEEASSIFYNEFERAAYSKPIQGNKYDPNNPHETLNKAYLDKIRQRQQAREQTVKRHNQLRQQLESDHPSDVPKSETEINEIKERHRKLREQALLPSESITSKEQSLSAQFSITPQKRGGVPDLQKPSSSIASITLPPINAGTQQMSGGQGRGQAATHSYSVQSTTNNMLFSQVLTASFSDKMNIVVG